MSVTNIDVVTSKLDLPKEELGALLALEQNVVLLLQSVLKRPGKHLMEDEIDSLIVDLNSIQAARSSVRI